VLTKEEDVGVIGCVLGVQECGLSTTLQQFETKGSKTCLDPPSTIQRWST